MKIRLDSSNPKVPCGFLIVGDNDSDILIQTDWDFPGLASTFGWEGLSDHDGTDGTVTCPHCGKKAGAFIAEAYDFLKENDGAEANDPGYFTD